VPDEFMPAVDWQRVESGLSKPKEDIFVIRQSI